MAGPGTQVAELFVEAERSPTKNYLYVSALGLPALRRVRIAMRPSNRTNQVTRPAPWWVNARAVVQAPETDLAPIGGTYRGAYQDIHFAPSLVFVPPLGSPLMSVFEIFLPAAPRVMAVSILFSAELDAPATNTYAWGYPDATPHDYDGMFLTPFGVGPVLRRDPDDHAPRKATPEEFKRRL
jgi:hypothetical protein